MSEPAPSIGPASIDDVPELARLRWELYAEQGGELSETPDAYRERFARFAASALTSGSWRSWVARDGDRLVGAMWMQTVHRVPVPGKRAGPIGYLTNVYVEPGHRNAGLGARMLDRVRAWCREEGFSLVIVWPTERSRSFYRRGGFDRPDEPLVMDIEPDTPLER
ncbi:MAG TPA: GNAT family N-acetyltransferase [Actinomycetota bacterium]|nr:GNAT family N-acetyltransferase [Actinomycetota bacterium]